MNLEYEVLKLKERVEYLENLLLKKDNKEKIENIKQKEPYDKTKYMFKGKILPKNRLVLNIVQDYVKLYNPTFNELKIAFDNSLQGSLGVIKNFEDVKTISDYKKRFFTNENDLIFLKDGTTISVCTQWGIFNINKFIKQAESLGFTINSI